MATFMSVKDADVEHTPLANNSLTHASSQIWLLALRSNDRDELARTNMRLIRILRDSGDFVQVNSVSRDHRSALLILKTWAKGLDLDAQEKIHQLIREAFSQAAAGGDVGLKTSGAPMLALSSRQQIKTESQRLSLAAGLFMLIFLGGVYVSPRRVLLSSLPLMGGMLFAAAMVSFVYGSLHGITLAFGITLLGVAVDYPVHVFSHQRTQESPTLTVRRIWPTLRLGVVTTALGYSAMALSDLNGLTQLGLFSISGLIAAALITVSLLPTLLDGHNTRPPQLMNRLQGLNIRPGKAAYLLALISVTVLIISLWRTGLVWSEDITELSPLSSELRLQHTRLREQIGLAETEDHRLVDAKANANRLLHHFRTEALQRIYWALGVIVLILGLSLASLRRLLKVMLPVLLAVGVASAIPLVLGEKLNLFHLVSLLLVAGIGLDYGLFFSRPSTEDTIQTLHALLVCAISTSTVFAMLAFSDIPVLHAIGVTVSTGTIAAFVYAWLFSRTNTNEN